MENLPEADVHKLIFKKVRPDVTAEPNLNRREYN